MNTRALQLAGDACAEAVALNTSALYVGISVAGALGGWAIAAHGGRGGAVVAAVICVVTVIAMAGFVRRYPSSASSVGVSRCAPGESGRAPAERSPSISAHEDADPGGDPFLAPGPRQPCARRPRGGRDQLGEMSGRPLGIGDPEQSGLMEASQGC